MNEIEVNEIEMLDLVLDQIGGVRIQFNDEDTRMRLQMVCQNLMTLKDALLKARTEAEAETEAETETETETTPPEEAAENV